MDYVNKPLPNASSLFGSPDRAAGVVKERFDTRPSGQWTAGRPLSPARARLQTREGLDGRVSYVIPKGETLYTMKNTPDFAAPSESTRPLSPNRRASSGAPDPYAIVNMPAAGVVPNRFDHRPSSEWTAGRPLSPVRQAPKTYEGLDGRVTHVLAKGDVLASTLNAHRPSSPLRGQGSQSESQPASQQASPSISRASSFSQTPRVYTATEASPDMAGQPTAYKDIAPKHVLNSPLRRHQERLASTHAAQPDLRALPSAGNVPLKVSKMDPPLENRINSRDKVRDAQPPLNSPLRRHQERLASTQGATVDTSYHAPAGNVPLKVSKQDPPGSYNIVGRR